MINTPVKAGDLRFRRLEHRGTKPDSQKPVSGFTFALYLYFLVDFFLHFAARVPAYGSLRPTLLLVLLLTMLLVFQKEKFKGWTKDPVMQAVLVFMVYLVLSLPLVEWPGSVIRNNLPEFIKAVVFLFFTALIVDSEKRLKIFLVVFVGCQILRVAEPLLLNVTQGYWGSKTHLGGGEFSARLAGAPSDVINPNELGFVIVTIIPFLHYLLLPGKIKAKLLYLITMPPLLYALILTQSRGAFLALLVVAWMVFRVSNHKKVLIMVAIGIAISGWSVMSADQKDRYLSLVGMSDSSNSATAEGRFEGMKKEFTLSLNRPLFGHGLGTTSEAKANLRGRSQAAHNFYAEILIETGFIGLVFFLRFLQKVYSKFRENFLILERINADESPSLPFFYRLNQALVAVFWMYVVYSTNYWGLSQYYWYLFAGLVIVFSNRLSEQSESFECKDQPSKGKFTRQIGIGTRYPMRREMGGR